MPKDKTETEYHAEECLMLAEEKMFIVGGEGYHFTSDKVKAYFKAQLLRREKLYHASLQVTCKSGTQKTILIVENI